MSKEIEAHVLQIYETINFLGSGAYGHVWKVKHRITQKEYALKKIFDAFQNDVDAQRTYRQVTILPQLNHQNIITLHEVIKANNGRDLYLVFQFMETDLHSVLGEKILQETHIKFITYQLCKVLKYLHSAQLIHRDLKSSNILLNSSCEIKICDFGLVRSLISEEDTQPILSEDVATRWYRSPEMLLGSQAYGKATDIWSLGCIIAQLVRGEPIFPGNSTLHQLEKIMEFTGIPSADTMRSLNSSCAQSVISQVKVKKRSLKSYIGDCDEEVKDLILRMLEFDPSQRITAQQALQLPCLQEFRGKCREDVCHKFITTEIDDNVRLTLEEYRRKIYCDIERRYPTSNVSTTMPRITRSYHSVESNSFHQYRRLASNSLVKLEKKNTTFHQENSDGFANKKIIKRPPKSIFQKQNQDYKDQSGCASLQHTTQIPFQKSSTKVFKRKLRGNYWAKQS